MTTGLRQPSLPSHQAERGDVEGATFGRSASRPWRILLNRHQGTEIQGDGASPGTALLFNMLDQLVAGFSVPIRTPPYYPMDARGSVRIAIESLQGTDACLFGLPRRPPDLDPFFLTRARLGLRLPALYLPLGEFPRGAWIYRHLWRHLGPSDALLFSCHADLAVYRRLVASSPARAVVLPFGIDTDRFVVPLECRETVRRHFGLTPDQVLLVYHGRVCPEKNLTSVLSLLRELRCAGLAVRLWLIGPIDGADETGGGPRRLDQLPFTPLLSQLAHELPSADLLESVGVWGAQPHSALPTLLSAADVAVQLTLNPDENFGFAAVEAMAAGLPLLGSDWGGLKDTIDHGVTGWRMATSVQGERPRVDDAQLLDRAHALVTDPAQRQRMGRAARQRALSHYGLQRWASALQAILQQQIVAAREAPQHPAPVRQHRWSALGERLVAAYQAPEEEGPYDALPDRVPPFHSFDEQPLMREVMASYASARYPVTDRTGEATAATWADSAHAG